MPDLQYILTLMQQGQTAEARPLLQQVQARFPAYTPACVLLAQVCEAERSWQEALHYWQQAAFLMPNSPTIREGLRRTVRMHTTAAAAPPQVLPLAEMAPPHDGPSVIEAIPPVTEEVSTEAGVPVAEAVEVLAAGAATTPLAPAEDLDRLIQELSVAPRIVPNPDFEALAPPDLDDEIDDMVSRTLAEIYTNQRQYDEAARVYEQLALQEPENAREFMRKAAEMRRKAKKG